MPTRDSHAETMVKKSVRAHISLLRDDWFLPLQAAALDKALVYVGEANGLGWAEASRRAITETYDEFGVQGLAELTDQKAIEADTSKPKAT